MPCLIVIVALMLPRLTLFFIWALSQWPKEAFEGWFWPLVGWLFMPFTTLAYMAGMLQNNHHISGFWAFLLVIAVLIDIASWFGSESSSKGYYR